MSQNSGQFDELMDIASGQPGADDAALSPSSSGPTASLSDLTNPPDATESAPKAGSAPGSAADPAPSSLSGSAASAASAAGLSDLWAPSVDPADATGQAAGHRDLAQQLIDSGAATQAMVSNAQGIVERTPGAILSEAIIEQGADEVQVQEAVARFAGLNFERCAGTDVSEKYLSRLGHDFCVNRKIVPLRTVGSRLILGMARPNDVLLVDEIRHKLNIAIKPVVVTFSDINQSLEMFKEEEQDQDVGDVDDIIGDIEEDDVEVVESKEEEVDLEKMAGESPVIRFVNYLIFNAVKEGASDIHIEPQEKKLQIRYRIDGVLFESMNPPPQMHAAIISRLKIMANLDISERRLPQDGRIRVMMHGRKLDLRLSTLPTAQGEKAVMRILDTRSIQVSLDDLGMSEDILTVWKNQISHPHGIILVTGPTGSGKTTTLYSSLGQMDKGKLNISTVEDPVEYHLNGINQVQTYERIGMSFSAALRSLLRQDPDVVMVGEIRDAETARIAIQASLTGHLVLSTLHTNDAPSSITRLINIGVEPYLIGAAVNGCLAQRLVRRNCENCKEQVKPDDHVAEHLAMHGVAIDQVWKGQGCNKCRGTGYAGRLGIYELLVLDDLLRDKIASNPSVTEFRRMCVERGMNTLRQDGFLKVQQGRTTVDEVLRVTEATI